MCCLISGLILYFTIISKGERLRKNELDTCGYRYIIMIKDMLLCNEKEGVAIIDPVKNHTDPFKDIA